MNLILLTKHHILIKHSYFVALFGLVPKNHAFGKTEIFYLKQKIKSRCSSICITNQELNNLCQKTDIADQNSYLLSRKLQY